MTTLTEIVAAVVVHSSTVALGHFGVTLEPARVERPQPAAEAVVARTPRRPDAPVEATGRPRQTAYGARA